MFAGHVVIALFAEENSNPLGWKERVTVMFA